MSLDPNPQGAEPREDGWIVWTGGESPVPGTRVELRLRSGLTSGVLASEEVAWERSSVIAYRVVSPAPAAPTNGGGGAQILKGVGKINGDGWKDTTTIGEVVFVWNEELPSPFGPGQYRRVGKEHWTASTAQYDFAPASVAEARAALQPQPTQQGGTEGREDALRRLEVMRDQARNGTAVTDPNEWEADELDAILAALKTEKA